MYFFWNKFRVPSLFKFVLEQHITWQRNEHIITATRNIARVVPCLETIRCATFGWRTKKCSAIELQIWSLFLANYNDVSRGHPKWRFSKGIPSPNPLNWGLGIILICPDIWSKCFCTCHVKKQKHAPSHLPLKKATSLFPYICQWLFVQVSIKIPVGWIKNRGL